MSNRVEKQNVARFWDRWAVALTVISLGVGAVTLPAFAIGTGDMGGDHLTAIKTGALYPEGLEYNAKTGKFLLASFREGAVYEVGQDGKHRLLVEDDRLTTGMGLRVDAKRNRLYVVSSDVGISVRQSSEGKMMKASLGVYDLTSGEPINFIDLGSLRPTGEKHIANDLAVDPDGNVYVTDSLAPVIYKVDPQGNASIFLEDKSRFTGKGFNLNGIIYHPDGYLIVAKKNEGVLFKVPVADPTSFSQVEVPQEFVGADGLILLKNNSVAVIANRASGVLTDAVFSLSSADDWQTAEVTGQYTFANDGYPTTGIVKDGQIFVVHSKINRLMTENDQEKAEGYPQRATIQQVGTVKP